MQTSASPIKIAVPFADSGAKQAIPVASPGVPGRASFTTGFPAETMIPIASGGIAPYGTDFNGVFNAITNSLRWNGAGGTYAWNSAFSAAVGGYPKGAFISTAAYDGYWTSTVENNTSNPDSGGAGWRSVPLQGGNYSLDTGTANTYTAAFSPPIVTLSDGLVLLFRAKTANTGASTFLSVPLIGGAQQPLQGGEIVADGLVQVVYIATISSFVLLSSTGGSPQVPTATKPLHAVNLTQAQLLAANARGAVYINASGAITGPGVYFVDTSAGVVTLTLPASPVLGFALTFIDANNSWDAFNMVLDLNGKTIEGQPSPLNCGIANAEFSMFYGATTWELV